MSKKLNLVSFRTVTLAFALLFGTTLVYAGDAKTYPGSMGVRWSGSNPSFNHSAIGNPSSTQWLYVDLPVINDSMSENIHNSWVRVLDRHYSSDIRCSFNTAYWNNTGDTFYGWWGANRSSNGSSNKSQFLSTGSSGGAGALYHHYFSCRIPPTYSNSLSYIISYHANED